MASGAGGDASSQNEIPRGLVNRTGNPIARGSRLPSLRGQRDLTLGGIQRKVFKPNLASVKKNNKDDNAQKTEDGYSPSSVPGERGKGRERGRGRGERGRGRGRGRGEDRTIQLQSEFAYGPLGSSSSGWSRSRESNVGGGGSGGGKSGAGESSAVKTATFRRSHGTEEDKMLLDSIMRDDFVSDLSAGDPSMAPIRLPLNINAGVKLETKAEVKVEPHETTIKMEMEETDTDIKTTIDSTISKPKSVREIFQTAAKCEKGDLLFLQLPDVLPGLPDIVLTDDRNRPSTSTGFSNDELSNLIKRCYLKDCQEGHVGKLRIRKSGKAELVFGDNNMEVLPAIPSNFHQELVSIHTDDCPGQMVVLGEVPNKLIVAPNYNQLINNINCFS